MNPDPSPQPAFADHERLVAALKASRAGTWRWDITNDSVEWDDALCAVYGLRREDAPKKSGDFIALVHEEDRDRVWKEISDCIERGGEAEYEFRAVVDSAVRWIYDRNAVIKDEHGKPAYMLGACLDVTERRRIEQERDAALEKHKLLLQEITHRTKNHLAMVCALLRLKGSRQKDPAARHDFDRAIERVNTIAFLHEQLYRTDAFDRLDIQTYLERICTDLADALLAESRVSMSLDLEPAQISTDFAVPIGLIVNEVVTNAAKYAFTPGQEGRIIVRFRKRGDRGTLTIFDNGRGLPEPRSPGIGSKLLRALSAQIGARMRTVSRDGLTYSFSFALPSAE